MPYIYMQIMPFNCLYSPNIPNQTIRRIWYRKPLEFPDPRSGANQNQTPKAESWRWASTGDVRVCVVLKILLGGGGGFKYFLYFHPILGEDDPILTSIFCRWVGSTTNQF